MYSAGRRSGWINYSSRIWFLFYFSGSSRFQIISFQFSINPRKRGFIMSDSNKFGDTLIKLRLQSGYTQNEIASFTGISRSCYCHFESNYRMPKIDFLIRLCILYKANPVQLLLPIFPDECTNSQKSYLQYLKSLCTIKYKPDTKRSRKRKSKCWSKK